MSVKVKVPVIDEALTCRYPLLAEVATPPPKVSVVALSGNAALYVPPKIFLNIIKPEVVPEPAIPEVSAPDPSGVIRSNVALKVALLIELPWYTISFSINCFNLFNAV